MIWFMLVSMESMLLYMPGLCGHSWERTFGTEVDRVWLARFPNHETHQIAYKHKTRWPEVITMRNITVVAVSNLFSAIRCQVLAFSNEWSHIKAGESKQISSAPWKRQVTKSTYYDIPHTMKWTDGKISYNIKEFCTVDLHKFGMGDMSRICISLMGT